MAEQDLILGKDRRHMAKTPIDPKKAAADTLLRRSDDEEELRQLLQDLIRTEIKNLFVKK